MGKRAHGEGTISRRKDGRWEGRASIGYKPDGKPKRHVVYGATQGEAREKLEAIKRQLATGTYSDAKVTVKEYLERWLSEKQRDVKPTTLENQTICVNRFLVPRIGSVKLQKLTPLQVQTFINEVRDASGPARAAKCRAVLLNAYRQAVRWQLVARNPVEATDPVKEPHREMRLWESEQAACFLEVAEGHRLYPLFYLSMATGLRRGELLGLRWVDLEGRVLHVEQALVKVGGKLLFSTPKTRKGFRSIALSPDVLEVLLLHRQLQDAERLPSWPDNGLVFVSETGTPLNPDNLTRLRKQLMTDAKVPRVRLHDLRHLHAVMAIKSGVDPEVLADRLGHSRASFTLNVYTHLFEEQRMNAAVSLLDFLLKSDPSTAN